ncbi:putative membrane protein [Tritonibacter multivorans]|uniref:Putative membrane protein n=1 Tax=Tritonibacter multivorans TaxID=928856 RepID=A0A0P1FZL9_9RHOB|nr:TadE/TadG family type IV pilus assembly protein [Tritonibacter multivorans]MDA7422459.1 pilus assembly protein TadG-related protein [Tritonibacter multivorans]CUH74903.1 putative membrane protein [Tritonibacter multivorans]SFD43415.1 Flp pilus assembly protein TadG [Tritonibacter multivorans]
MQLLLRLLRKEDDGYVLVLTLLLLPIFLGASLLMVDVGRVTNAHADLQTVADATALTAARELDGSPNAIANARLAMAEVSNSVSMLSAGGDNMLHEISFSTEDGAFVSVAFLDAIPTQDDTPIDATWLAAHRVADSAATDAAYVYVHVQAGDFEPLAGYINEEGLFARPASRPIGAVAVAKVQRSVCNVPPLFICNPFEEENGVFSTDGLREAFRQGLLHGRMIKLQPLGSDDPAPGHYGFLETLAEDGSISLAADAARHIYAGKVNPTCYSGNSVTPSTVLPDEIKDGFNTRFDILKGAYNVWNNNDPGVEYEIAPARNVRKGYKPGPVKFKFLPEVCTTVVTDDHFDNADGETDVAYGLPDDPVMTRPPLGVTGAFIGGGSWSIDQYLEENYGAAHVNTIKNQITSSFPNRPPSRFDVYLAEQTILHPDTGEELYKYTPAGGESGEALCAATKPATRGIDPVSDPDRRQSFAVIVDCIAGSAPTGLPDSYPVNSFASIFLARPIEEISSPGGGTLDLEIIDMSGSGNEGGLENLMRVESVLVR